MRILGFIALSIILCLYIGSLLSNANDKTAQNSKEKTTVIDDGVITKD